MKFRSILLLALFSFLSRAASAQQKFIAEVFANINCSNCRLPDDQFATYLASHPDICQINIHDKNTDPTDLFYLAANPSAENRDNFYSAGAGLADPVAFINGTFAGQGKNNEPLWERTHQLSAPLSPITVTKSVAEDGVITLNFSVVAAKPAKLYVALKESKVIFHNTEQYGETPGDLWNDIFRSMLPTPTGSSKNFVGSQSFTVTYDPSSNSDWNVENMQAVIFVQEVQESDATHSHPMESMAVVALGSTNAVRGSEGSYSARLHLTSNPTPRLSHVGVELPTASAVRVTLTDLLGRTVQTLADTKMPAGSTSIQLEGNGIPAGCYFLQLLVDGHEADHTKVVIQ